MPKIAVIADFIEERWPSMDLAAEQLTTHLGELPGIDATLVRHQLASVVPGSLPSGLARAIGRFVQLPCQVAAERFRADYFHIADHSYAHLALLFPRDRVGVFCHDIDAFRALLPGAAEPPSRVFLSRLLLRGLQHARVVFHTTMAVRNEILLHGLVPERRLVQAPLGVADEYLKVRVSEGASEVYILHVSSCIPRKNVDFLLQVFNGIRQRYPALRLLQIGGEWTDSQRAYIDRHGLRCSVEQRRGLSRDELAMTYARAALVLVPSLAEGFGLPVIEALACGTPVVASDIPVLREVGFEGVRFCNTTDTTAWVSTVQGMLLDGRRVDDQTRARVHERFSWRRHAATIADAYVGGASSAH